jgi:hypothetical protein
MLERYEKTRKERPREEELEPPPTHSLRGLLRAQALAEKKDVAALVALCQKALPYGGVPTPEAGLRDLTQSAAAEALAGLGAAAVDPVKAALAKRPEVTGWLIYALGRSSAPSALEVLKQVAERGRGDDHERAGNIAYALALKGETGKKVLKRLAKRESAMGEAAREWLGRKAEPAWPAPTWPRPKAGSLPKTLPAVR